MTSRLGQQLGNYRLLRLLGAGGFAEVYLGEHVYLNTQAAIKVLQTRLADDERERFLHEARIIARLIHPRIVRVLEFGLEEDTPFLVMDYAQGGNLRQRLPKDVPLSAATILPYVKQVAEALQYAHDQQLVHRDVKPENMLLGGDDEVLLSDFGIALIAQSVRLQSAQEVFGTASYMAPEQIQGKAEPASDQYALGVVIYEWLCGELPFYGSFTELCSQHLFAPPPPLREKVPGIMPTLEAVVEKALAKDAHDRFPGVQELASAFEETCSLESPDASEIEPPLSRPAASTSKPVSATPSHPPKKSRKRRSATPVSIAAPGTSSALTQYPEAPPSPVIQSEEGSSIPATQRAPAATSELPVLPTLPSSAQKGKRGISRRNLIVGIGLAGLAVASGITGLVLTRRESTPPASTTRFTAPPSPTPSSSRRPLGTTLLTYHGHSGVVYALSSSPNGQYIASASADTTVRVWSIATGETLYTYHGHAGLLNSVFSVSWASNGSYIASGGADKTVQVWNAATGKTAITYREHTARVLAVAWSPDATLIASGGADKTVQVWEASTGTLLSTYRGHTATVYTLAWSPDGKYIASGGADKTVQVWEASTSTPVYTYRGHSDTVYTLAWSPDEKYIASAGADRTVHIVDALSGKQVYTYNGHVGLQNVVSAVAWRPDGKRIASGSTDKTVQVWDATTGKHIYAYRGHSGTVYGVEWSPDGGRIASGSADTTVRIWQAS
jgi:eukaryotic-like serine/threonine-protein kinase